MLNSWLGQIDSNFELQCHNSSFSTLQDGFRGSDIDVRGQMKSEEKSKQNVKRSHLVNLCDKPIVHCH